MSVSPSRKQTSLDAFFTAAPPQSTDAATLPYIKDMRSLAEMEAIKKSTGAGRHRKQVVVARAADVQRVLKRLTVDNPYELQMMRKFPIKKRCKRAGIIFSVAHIEELMAQKHRAGVQLTDKVVVKVAAALESIAAIIITHIVTNSEWSGEGEAAAVDAVDAAAAPDAVSDTAAAPEAVPDTAVGGQQQPLAETRAAPSGVLFNANDVADAAYDVLKRVDVNTGSQSVYAEVLGSLDFLENGESISPEHLKRVHMKHNADLAKLLEQLAKKNAAGSEKYELRVPHYIAELFH